MKGFVEGNWVTYIYIYIHLPAGELHTDGGTADFVLYV